MSQTGVNFGNLTRINTVPTQNAPQVRFATWNARSLRSKKSKSVALCKHKTAALCDLVISHHLDILAITESWLKGDERDDQVIADIKTTLPNYEFHHVPRLKGRAGGVAVLARHGLRMKVNETTPFQSFEHMDLHVSSASSSIRLIVIYRPPPSTENGLTPSMFLDDFASFMEPLALTSTPLFITGDLNVHVDDSSDHHAGDFCGILDNHDLEQHVHLATHRDGHTLDLLITRKSDDLVSSVSVHDDMPSDHAAVKCQIKIDRPAPSRKQIRSRKLRNVDLDSFRKDVNSSCLNPPVSEQPVDLDEVCDKFCTVLRSIIDKHAPVNDRTVILRPHSPWYSDALRKAKQVKRQSERRYRSSGLAVHKELYRDQCNIYQDLLAKAKTSYHSQEISDATERGNLFRVVDKLVKPYSGCSLPSHKDSKELADRFVNFFHQKISSLRERLDSVSSVSTQNTASEHTSRCSFASFSAVSENDVLNTIKSSHVTSCLLDPLPVSMFKECMSDLLPVITTIVNRSLLTGQFPSSLKHAVITPLLKKSKLDADTLANYRPISNLSYLGKLIERIAISQLQVYLRDNNLMASMQSAYRPHHSTESALLRVYNDVLCALDKGKEALLVLLDFSSAFDTIDHQLLFRRLNSRYGISGTALSWIKSYLKDRTQSVVINDTVSDKSPLIWGVPQGSVAGPLLFTLYSAPLQDVISAHGVNVMFYADDTQLYLIFDPVDRDHAIHVMEECIVDVKAWALENKLVLNDAKTEFVHFKSRFSRSTAVSPCLSVGDSDIEPTQSARNLGVIVDSTLCMNDHIDAVCRSALAAIRKISQIRQYLSDDNTATLVHAFVTSRLDACNSLIYGLPDKHVSKLQRIQNTAARLVARVPRFHHITPTLQSLHWLPIKHRSVYKLLLIAYKAQNGLAPQYISDLLVQYSPKRQLRSSNKSLLSVSYRASTKYYGDRSLIFAAPTLWNNLPHQIRSADTLITFKRLLKTHLFCMSF